MPSPASDVPAEFLVLGPLDAVRGGETMHVTSGRVQVVLAVLLLEAGRPVPVHRLISALWGDDPPATARSQVQICVSTLRRELTGTGAVIATQSAGYVLRIPEGSLDLWRFHDLCAAAEGLALRQPAEAAGLYRQALALWRGEACESVESHVVAQAAIRLNEEHWTALERCMDLELQLGRHQQVAGELAQIVAAEPLRERPRAQLMLALYRSGRQAEALEVYRAGRQALVEELGTDPGKELRALEQAILTMDPALDVPPRPAEASPDDVPAALPLPRQLPASVPDFVGRQDLVQHAHGVLRRPAGDAGEGGSVPVVLLTGRGGIGKTTLALSIAHGIRGDFPDGQLFARLRSSGGPATNPAGVLEQFLRSLGVPANAVPDRLEARTAMFRSCLAGQRVLIVLDDAAVVSQVEPLLPGESGCGVIITSRTRPAPPGAIQLEVDALKRDAAAELLDRVVGADRIAAEPEAAAELIRLCEGHPLALRIVASKLAARRHWRIARMVQRLTDEQQRLNELNLEGMSIRATLEFSYRNLPDAAQLLLNRLGLLDHAEFPAWVSAPLLDMPVAAAEEVIEDLVTAGVVEARVTDAGVPRYRIHDMVRLFAREKLADMPAGERLAPVRRYLGCWLYLIGAANRRLHGGDFHVVHGDAPLWSPPDDVLADMLAAPLDWFHQESGGLFDAVFLAARVELDEFCWDLAVTAVTFFELGGYPDEWRQTHEAALSVVRHAGNDRGTAALLHSLGLRATGRDLEQARSYLHQSLDIWRRAGDPHGEALAFVALANLDRLSGTFDTAATGYARALDGFADVRDLAGQASALRGLGQVAMEREDYDQGLCLLERSASLAREAGATRDTAQSMYYSSELLLRRGDLRLAEDQLRQVVDMTRESQDTLGEGYALLGLANVRIRTGRLTQASSDLARADGLARASGDMLLHARVLLVSAEISLAAGVTSVARDHLTAVGETLAAIGSPPLWEARLQELERKLDLLSEDIGNPAAAVRVARWWPSDLPSDGHQTCSCC
jgi:DNA-binding SARP family transcriptional activator/tetratricopeptide (TPR) repeat protein